MVLGLHNLLKVSPKLSHKTELLFQMRKIYINMFISMDFPVFVSIIYHYI